MSAKAAVYHLLLDFSLEVTEKTDVPIKIAKTAAGFSAENGIHLELRPR
jgi:cytochrome P450 family 9